MAGGAGERFWPLSRATRPKQLLDLTQSGHSMIAAAFDRIAPLVSPENIVVATSPPLVDPIRSELPHLGKEAILAEPHRRDTAGCMVWVAAHLLARDENAREGTSMAVVASDHFISPANEFQRTVDSVWRHVEATGALGTIGIQPSRPETGYGYIETGESVADGVLAVDRFREKPDVVTAQSFLAAGNFLWNSGMFFWRLDAMLSELERQQPLLAEGVQTIASRLRQGEHGAAADAFSQLPKISVDYAIMEHAERVVVAPASFEWDDAGSWDALERFLPADESGNTLLGNVLATECKGSIFFNEGGPEVVALGLEDVVVVSTADAVLVVPKARAQEVKKVIDRLRAVRPDLL